MNRILSSGRLNPILTDYIIDSVEKVDEEAPCTTDVASVFQAEYTDPLSL